MLARGLNYVALLWFPQLKRQQLEFKLNSHIISGNKLYSVSYVDMPLDTSRLLNIAEQVVVPKTEEVYGNMALFADSMVEMENLKQQLIQNDVLQLVFSNTKIIRRYNVLTQNVSSVEYHLMGTKISLTLGVEPYQGIDIDVPLNDMRNSLDLGGNCEIPPFILRMLQESIILFLMLGKDGSSPIENSRVKLLAFSIASLDAFPFRQRTTVFRAVHQCLSTITQGNLTLVASELNP